jgi:hypothetical protein
VAAEPTPEEIEALILAAIEESGEDELVRWSPIRNAIPGDFWAVERAAERLRCRGEVGAMKIAGTPYVWRGDDADRHIARKYDGNPPVRIIA